MKKPILILKIGTASITKSDGSLDEPAMVEIARQVALLHRQYRLVLVSSGAVGTGKKYLNSFQGSITDRKAAAAIGNPILMGKYSQFFSPYGIAVAQSLCERQHFSSRRQFLQLRETFHTLWDHGIIPIANENDVVSNLELKFSDNDELATLIAVGFGADQLLLGTSVPGVYDQAGQLVDRIPRFNSEVMGWARKETSSGGLGGMISKLTFAKLATKMGTEVVIFGAKSPNGIIDAAAGRTGTICEPQPAELSARKKWLASGCLVAGQLILDEGAKKAMEARKSLLAVGVKTVQGEFSAGEVVELLCEDGRSFALARVKINARNMQTALGTQDVEVAHADEIVLLD
ncbi:glutamate 5-kinase [Pontibacter sp. G13]|uniref:glutamate 5-kinase n=1 Tax=Pontibacter sp. G13 TaxID=3074898 RepID=UPI0028893F37|nr:glutamate 5-kinase [Pontibacter sp. G13]WNJ16293.1 glutamate 5-kinase [Pontibacter sp. G13]